MREIVTRGYICLDDEYGFTYRIAQIEYCEKEDGNYSYTFIPFYNVIELLPTKLFQGIPGLDLSLKKEKYVRENMTPVFISERTPGENRENLWELLEACNMEYLNRLEWLIRTDTRYSGDLMYVIRAEETLPNIEIENLGTLDSRSAGLVKRLLEVICYGGTVKTREFSIDDSNRKELYTLLMTLYSKEKKYIETQKKEGIRKAAKMGKYKGRDKIQIDDSRLMEIMWEYESNKITGAEAASKLNISLSTFNRRYREYRESLSLTGNI